MRMFFFATLLLTAFTGCSSNSKNHDKPLPPHYALMQDFDRFQIKCGRTVINVRGSILDLFYLPDGSQKSQNQFCDENVTTNTHIKR